MHTADFVNTPVVGGHLTAGNPYINPHVTRPARFPSSDGYQPLDRKHLGHTFSDCTTAPRHGPVSSFYPLVPFYRHRDERTRLATIKARLKEAS